MTAIVLYVLGVLLVVVVLLWFLLKERDPMNLAQIIDAERVRERHLPEPFVPPAKPPPPEAVTSSTEATNEERVLEAIRKRGSVSAADYNECAAEVGMRPTTFKDWLPRLVEAGKLTRLGESGSGQRGAKGFVYRIR